MKSRLLVLSISLASALVFGVAACSDPNNQGITPSPVTADTLTVFALTGTSPSFPSGYLASSSVVTRADGNFNFDVAFDIDPAGNVVVYPQKLIGVPCIPGVLNCGGALGAKPVGLQRIIVAFDTLQLAPTSGYVFDSSFVLTPGKGLVMQVQSANECQFSVATTRYTKFVVDSADVTRRAVYFRAVHDPNCGYRTLIAGVTPKN